MAEGDFAMGTALNIRHDYPARRMLCFRAFDTASLGEFSRAE